MLRKILIVSIVGAVAACAALPQAQLQSAATAAAPIEATKSAYIDKSLNVDSLIVGGQIQAIDVEALKGAGVTRVINLRTPEEMQPLGFDESAALNAGACPTGSCRWVVRISPTRRSCWTHLRRKWRLPTERSCCTAPAEAAPEWSMQPGWSSTRVRRHSRPCAPWSRSAAGPIAHGKAACSAIGGGLRPAVSGLAAQRLLDQRGASLGAVAASAATGMKARPISVTTGGS